MTTTLTRVRIKDTALDQGEEPHPLQGVTGTVLETFPMDEAGADCLQPSGGGPDVPSRSG